jgi:hypothetical protein
MIRGTGVLVTSLLRGCGQVHPFAQHFGDACVPCASFSPDFSVIQHCASIPEPTKPLELEMWKVLGSEGVVFVSPYQVDRAGIEPAT